MAPVATEQMNGETSSKRIKTVTRKRAPTVRQKLFQPFRALGLITDHVPFVLSIKHGGKDASRPDVNIIACIGTSWTMWDADRMTLLFVGEPLPNEIQSLCVVGGSGGKDNIFATSGKRVFLFQRGRLIDQYTTRDEDDLHEEEAGTLKDLITIGDSMLSLSSLGSFLYVWSISRKTLSRRLDLQRPLIDSEGIFSATCMLHPSTYIDKILIGSASGHLQLYNFRTSTLLHTFSRSSLISYMGMEESSLEPDESLTVVDLVQTPAIDVVAVAYASGHILLLDIRYDEPIMCAHVSRGITGAASILSKGCLSFRTDGMAHTMAVGTRLGDIVLFDLQASPTESTMKKARPAQLAHTIRSAHTSSIASVQFVQGQPLLISSGSDNAIKQWFFEVSTVASGGALGGEASVGPTTVPRLLKSREGHSAPPRLIRFIGEDGKTIISTGGEDRSVRAMSVVRDSRSAELSQGSLQKKSVQQSKPLLSLKLRPTTSLSHSSTRSRDWDDLMTTHSGSSYAEIWSTRNQVKGRHQLSATTSENTNHPGEATTTCLSACGNFALVGNSLGFVEMYNIQSGRYRRRLDTRVEVVERVQRKRKGGVMEWREEKKRGAGSAITGVASDLINKIVVASTMDGGLYFFDFHTGQVLHHIDTATGISALLLDRSTNLVAAIQDDLTIKLYDIETFKMVRIFGGFAARILDATFSPNGKWLVVSSLDGFVRTFDIPTSRLVDYFRTTEVATSVSFSPIGDFLATTHVGSKGIYLWANRNQYLNLALSGIEEDEVMLQEGQETEALPTLRGVDVDELKEEDSRLKELDVGEGEYQRSYTSKSQLFIEEGLGGEEKGLITLSTMPRSRWMTLLNLDVLKARNKPKEAPKKPERAPFFLPMGAGKIPDSAIRKNGYTTANEVEQDSEEGDSRRMQTLSSVGLDVESDFARRLRLALDEDQVESLFLYLHTLSPPALDSEIRSLVRVSDVSAFLQSMTKRLRQHLDYDAIQAMVFIALQIHSDLIIQHGIKEVAGSDSKMIQDDEDDSSEAQSDEGKELGQSMRALMIEQYKEGNRVLELLQYCVGSLAFVRDLPLT
ncbi:hypothetical protein CBS101457_000820 [Exobasidium rhododendri]|nr:hypothetical protein CBS101457_000820 [Exobasidium rhododendri]